MNPQPCRCSRCGGEFASRSCLALHLAARPECRAYAVLAASRLSLCPRCNLSLSIASARRWTREGFVHISCPIAAKPARPSSFPVPHPTPIGAL